MSTSKQPERQSLWIFGGLRAFLQHTKVHTKIGLLKNGDIHSACVNCYPTRPPSVEFTTFWEWYTITFRATGYNGRTQDEFKLAFDNINTKQPKSIYHGSLKAVAHSVLYYKGPEITDHQIAKRITQYIKDQSYDFSEDEESSENPTPAPSPVPGQAPDWYNQKQQESKKGKEPEITITEEDIEEAAEIVQETLNKYNELHNQQEQPQQTLPKPVKPNQQNIMAMTAQEMATALQGIIGDHGQNLRSEASIIPVDTFSGKDSEDPVSWLEKFERAVDMNRWHVNRKVAIAGGYMRGQALSWFNDTKAAWVANNVMQYHNNDNNVATFKRDFEAKFNTEQRKNDWYTQLVSLKQGDSSVESYAGKFMKLCKRCGVDDDAQKRRMFLLGLNPAYITFVQVGTHGTLANMVTAAKQVEMGFNLATGKKVTKAYDSEEEKEAKTKPSRATNIIIPGLPKEEPKNEIDDLTNQIQQLSLNYATLTAALAAQTQPRNDFQSRNFQSQPRQNFQNRNFQNRQQRDRSRERRDITCFNCGQQGHIARNCQGRRNNNNGRRPQTRFVIPTNNTRSLNHNEYYYSDEEDDYVEAYVATRTGKSYQANRKAPYNKKRSESNKERELQITPETTPESTDTEMVEAPKTRSQKEK